MRGILVMCEQPRLDRQDRWIGGASIAGADSCAQRTAPSLMIAIMSPLDAGQPCTGSRQSQRPSATSAALRLRDRLTHDDVRARERSRCQPASDGRKAAMATGTARRGYRSRRPSHAVARTGHVRPTGPPTDPRAGAVCRAMRIDLHEDRHAHGGSRPSSSPRRPVARPGRRECESPPGPTGTRGRRETGRPPAVSGGVAWRPDGPMRPARRSRAASVAVRPLTCSPSRWVTEPGHAPITEATAPGERGRAGRGEA